MQHRIATITQKLASLGATISTRGLIDVDLMMDYTRVLYADLLELRNGMVAQKEMHIHEPTLDELTEAMLAAEREEDELQLEAAEIPEAVVDYTSVVVPEKRSPEPAPAAKVFPGNPLPLMPAVSKKLLFEDMIGINDRYLFQQELFQNDHVLYHKAIEAINAAGNLSEVNDWLQQQVPGHRQWDLYGEAGSTFYAILNRYFEQK